MSFKVHNGFKFRCRSFDQIHSFLSQLAAELRPRAEEKAARFLAQTAVRQFDNWSYFGLSTDESVSNHRTAMDCASIELTDRSWRVETKRVRDIGVDYSVSITILPNTLGRIHRDSQINEFYGLLFTEQPDFRQLIEYKPWFEDVSYWDNSDKPDEVSKAEWKRRKQLWEVLLGAADAVPALLGYSRDLIPERVTSYPGITQILGHLPEFEDRVEQITRASLFHDFSELDELTNLRSFLHWQETDDWQVAFKSRAASVAQVLVKDIRAKQLTKPFPAITQVIETFEQ